MPQLHNYKLFISHAWKYNDAYKRMVKFLDEANHFSYWNYSVPEHNPVDANNRVKLAEELRQQIRPTEIVVILGGMYVSHSDWIQFEIDYAKYLNKPILGIRPWNAQRMPQAIQDTADEIVGWNTSSIVEAIRRLS